MDNESASQPRDRELESHTGRNHDSSYHTGTQVGSRKRTRERELYRIFFTMVNMPNLFKEIYIMSLQEILSKCTSRFTAIPFRLKWHYA